MAASKSLSSRTRGVVAAVPPVAATLAALGLLGVTPLRADDTTPPPPAAAPETAPEAPRADAAPVATPETPAAEENAAPAALPKDDGAPEPPPEAAPDDSVVPDAKPAGETLPYTTDVSKPSAAFEDQGTKNENGQNNNGSSILPFGLGKHLRVGGSATTSFRSHSVSGGANSESLYLDEFENYNDARRVGPFQQSLDLTIQGKVFNLWDVNARLSNSRYGNYLSNQFGFNYKAKGTSINIGDVQAQLAGNSLVGFSRGVQGLMLGRDFGPVSVTAIASLTKGVTQRGAFRGDNKTGPYFLTGVSILEGTERLRVNGVDIRRGSGLEIDPTRPNSPTGELTYTLNYYTGEIYFNKILDPAQTVEYSYESQSFSSSPGLLTGTRLDFSLAGNPFGITYLMQKPTNGRRGPSTVTARFPIDIDPNKRYPLQGLDPSPAATVEVFYKPQAQALVENIDYELNRQQRYIRLKRVLPPDTSVTADASLIVRYKPLFTADQNDRSVMGVDGSFKLGNTGSLALQMGRSQTPDGKGTGQAMTATLSLKGSGRGDRNQWGVQASWRDVGAGFSTIDSVSGAFLQAEKGLNLGLNFSPSQYINITSSLVNSRVAQRNYGFTYGDTTADPAATASALNWVNNATFTTGISVALPNLPTLSFNHNQVTQTGSGAGATRSKFLSDSLDLSWRKGILSVSGSLARTQSQGRTVFSSIGLGNLNSAGGITSGGIIGDYNNGTAASLYGNDSSSTTSNLSLSLTPFSWLSMTGSLGFSNTKYGSSGGTTTTAAGSDSKARDFAYALTLTPLQNLSIQASISDSSNGQSTSGYYNNVVGGATGGGAVPVAFGQRTKQRQIALQYTPWQGLSLNFQTNRQLSLVPGYDNSESAGTQFGLTFSPWSKLQLTGQLVDQKVTYVGGEGSSNNRSYLVGGTFGPFGKLTVTTSLQRMNTGSALYYGSIGGEIPGIGGSGSGIGTGIGLPGSGAVSGSPFYTGRQTLGTLPTTGNPYGGSYGQRENWTIWATRVDYPIGGGRTLFASWESQSTRSPRTDDGPVGQNPAFRTSFNSQRSVGSIGMDFQITSILGFTLQTNLVQLNDHDNPQYSYRARTMNADLSARF